MIIEYGFDMTPFGQIIVARTWMGICDLQFIDNNPHEVVAELGRRWGERAELTMDNTMAHTVERVIFEGFEHEIKLDLKGTEFQLKVWEELRKVPFGTTISYGELARRIGKPKAVRAVATAVATNPVSMIVPCHRIIHSDGTIGQYRWGAKLKKQLIDWEKSHAKR
jgi:AraC family transcriptional regulator, regulatory protein of adaptative response / methylated-DNA-[protein]-cysteine methyltransferase